MAGCLDTDLKSEDSNFIFFPEEVTVIKVSLEMINLKSQMTEFPSGHEGTKGL